MAAPITLSTTFSLDDIGRYVATTEQGGMSHFTRTLLIAVGAIYVVMAALGLLQK